MRKLVICLSILVWAGSAALAQSPTARAADWRLDLQTLATSLPRLHPNFYTKTPRAAFDAAVAQLDQSIPSLTDAQITLEFARIVALGADAHTSLSLTQRSAGFRAYPIRVQWFTDGLFVTRAAPEFKRAAGKKLVRIGGADIQQVYASVEPVISHENDPWLQRISQDYLVIPEVLAGLGIVSHAESASFTFQDESGGTFDLRLTPAAATAPVNWVVAPDPAVGPLPLYQRDPALNYWFQYFSDSKTLYLKYNRCINAQNLSFSEFATKLLAFVDLTVSETTVMAVAPERSFRLFVEAAGAFGDKGSIQSGIAIANPSDAPVTVTLSLTNFAGGAVRPSTAITVPAQGTDRSIPEPGAWLGDHRDALSGNTLRVRHGSHCRNRPASSL